MREKLLEFIIKNEIEYAVNDIIENQFDSLYKEHLKDNYWLSQGNMEVIIHRLVDMIYEELIEHTSIYDTNDEYETIYDIAYNIISNPIEDSW